MKETIHKKLLVNLLKANFSKSHFLLHRAKGLRKTIPLVSIDTEIASAFTIFQCTTFPNGLTPFLCGAKLDVDLKMYKELYRNYSALL